VQIGRHGGRWERDYTTGYDGLRRLRRSVDPATWTAPLGQAGGVRPVQDL